MNEHVLNSGNCHLWAGKFLSSKQSPITLSQINYFIFLIVKCNNHLWAGNYILQLKTFLKLQKEISSINQ